MLGAHVHEGYGTYFVCVCVCVCVALYLHARLGARGGKGGVSGISPSLNCGCVMSERQASERKLYGHSNSRLP